MKTNFKVEENNEQYDVESKPNHIVYGKTVVDEDGEVMGEFFGDFGL